MTPLVTKQNKTKKVAPILNLQNLGGWLPGICILVLLVNMCCCD